MYVILESQEAKVHVDGYRGPELVRPPRVVSMTSDIWALGCITYELVFRDKAFPYDWDVGEYAGHRCEFRLPSLPDEMDEGIKCYITRIVYRTFEIDW
jgi:serine/threonine protein kinase